MKLVWTRRALDDRKAIRDHIAADSPGAALDFDGLLSANAASLADYPDLGRPGRVDGTRELVVHRNYIVIYKAAADVVSVLRVLHVARKWPPGGRNR